MRQNYVSQFFYSTLTNYQPAIEKYGYPYLTVYRPDLHQTLADRVRALKPDAIHLNSGAAGCEQSESGVTLVLRDGRRVAGDVLIGADGVKSTVRNALFGDDETNFTGMIAWRGPVSGWTEASLRQRRRA